MWEEHLKTFLCNHISKKLYLNSDSDIKALIRKLVDIAEKIEEEIGKNEDNPEEKEKYTELQDLANRIMETYQTISVISYRLKGVMPPEDISYFQLPGF